MEYEFVGLMTCMVSFFFQDSDEVWFRVGEGWSQDLL